MDSPLLAWTTPSAQAASSPDVPTAFDAFPPSTTGGLASSNVLSPEELVFGGAAHEAPYAPAGASQDTISWSPISHSSSGSSSHEPWRGGERDEKRRKNSEAAAKWRLKKKAKDESMMQRQEELERTQALLAAENESLKAQNKTLESQLSFFQQLLSSTMQRVSYEDELAGSLPLYQSTPDNESGGNGLLSSSMERKGLVCPAVVLLVVLTLGSEDFGYTSGSPMPAGFAAGARHHVGRTLLSLDDAPSGLAGITTGAERGGMLGSALQLLPKSPFSPPINADGMIALQLCGMIWLAHRARPVVVSVSQALPGMQQKLARAAIGLPRRLWKPVDRALTLTTSALCLSRGKPSLWHRFKFGPVSSHSE